MTTIRIGAGLLACAAALWAQDHAGQPVPEFTTGDECLFCHQTGVVPANWLQNPHAQTIHPSATAEGESLLGARTQSRRLKPAGYGKFAILSLDGKTWDNEKFAARCAGCHTTAVDPKTRAFATAALDCYVCHGVADLGHTKDTSLMWLSRKHAQSSRQILSICGQCHLRGGVSNATHLPYPTNFVAGDDLFRDFRIDLSKQTGHVYANARDILDHDGEVTCLSCHQVHNDSTQKHRRVLTSAICLECHNASGPKKDVKKHESHSELCEY